MKRRIRVAFVTWILGGLVVGGAARVVALPEVCRPVESGERARAVAGALTWLTANQSADGTFLYRYDANDASDEPIYNWVRHAGTILALEQAAKDGFDGAVEVGERAIEASLENVVSVGQGTSSRTGLIDDGKVSTGGTALLALALMERREAVDATDHDELIRSLLRHLLDSLEVGSDGVTRVRAFASLEMQFVGHEVSLFATGQTLFAFARAERIFPDEGWGTPAHPILEYLSTRKAAEEGFVPDMPDHWAAYALVEMSLWSAPVAFDPVELAWIKKQMGLASVMVRYESQISERGLNVLLRGHAAIGSAAGTHGESLANWSKLALVEPALASNSVALAERLECNSSLLISRQISDEDARTFADPPRVRGAWLSNGKTQVDYQQHAMSALLQAGEVERTMLSAGGELPRREPLPSSWLLVALSAFVLCNPPRILRTLRHLHLSRSINGLVQRKSKPSLGYLSRFVFWFGLAALNGNWLLRHLDTNVPTAVVACGVAGVIACLSVLFSRSTAPSLFFVVMRPELLIFGFAVSAGGRWWALMLGLLAALAWSRWALTRLSDQTLLWAARLTGLIGVMLCIMLVVGGVFAI